MRSVSLLRFDEIRGSPGVQSLQRPERGDAEARGVPPADVQGAVPAGGRGRDADDERGHRRVLWRNQAVPEPGRGCSLCVSFRSPPFAV